MSEEFVAVERNAVGYDNQPAGAAEKPAQPELEDILKKANELGASDVFVVVGQPVSYKIHGKIERSEWPILMPPDTRQILNRIYECADNRDVSFREDGDDDFAVSVKGVGRFRVNVYKQRGAWSVVMRTVAFNLPDVTQMGIPQQILEFSEEKKGLILVTGTAGSGKSTTLSFIIDEINKRRNCHILTLEDPIEFLHKHKKSIVSQREVSVDTESYAKALRAAMREAPDVILIGEMRDLETIEIAMTAAETGHLVLSTLHTVGAANTIDRIIDVFPPGQQQQIRVQLAMVLKSIVSMQLLPTKDGKRVPAFEILEATNAIKTMIRESKIHQIDSVIYSSAKDGMVSMDVSISELYKAGKIDEQTALSYAINPETVKRMTGIRE
ncbi:MAG: PilT/PilU family type 4a pilus ATPase [Lachnospiraceae bacterium]|nr:PilT/PilU family type 4a pilus ATPase [Lachnospiraceae bacterium]